MRAFDDIARGIEHDLFNALTPVEGYTELLLMDPQRLADPAQATAYLNAIMGAAQDAKATIQRMREFYYGYSAEALDIDAHGSISQVLAKALSPGEDTEEPEHPNELDDDDAGTESLSPREWDVLRLLSGGMKNRDIAKTLSVSENTVKTHIKAILSKLSLKNRTQAAAYALLDQQAYESTADAS